MRRHHPRHRRLRLLHGVGSPRHGSHRSRRRAVGKRHHQQLWPRRPRPRRRPRNARRPHRHPPQPPGLPTPRRRPPNGPRPRPGNRRAADRAVNPCRIQKNGKEKAAEPGRPPIRLPHPPAARPRRGSFRLPTDTGHIGGPPTKTAASPMPGKSLTPETRNIRLFAAITATCYPLWKPIP